MATLEFDSEPSAADTATPQQPGATIGAREPSSWERIKSTIGLDDDGPDPGEKLGPTNVMDLAEAPLHFAGMAGGAMLLPAMIEAGTIPAALGVAGRAALAGGRAAVGAGVGRAIGGEHGAQIGGLIGGFGPRRSFGALAGLMRGGGAIPDSPMAESASRLGASLKRIGPNLRANIVELIDSFRPGSPAVISDGEASAAERITPEVQNSILDRLNRAGLVGPSGAGGGPSRPDVGSTRWTPKSMIDGSASEADEIQRLIDDQKVRMLTGNDSEARAAKQEIARLERFLTTVGRQAARWAGRAGGR